MKHIILSIGAYASWEVKKLCRNKNLTFYCYDPLPGVYKSFQKTFADAPNVNFFNKAISISRAVRYLKCERTRSRLVNKEGATATGTFLEVETISLQDAVTDILIREGFKSQIELVVNCEGEEVPIILSTPIDLLKGFKRMKIEFHPQHYPYSQIELVLKKLSKYFKWTFSLTSIAKQPVYLFERKGNVD